MANVNDLFVPVEDVPDDAIPPRFEEAMELIQELNSRCRQAQIPEATQISALMVELMPRLVQAYGPDGVTAMLGELINEIAGDQPAPDKEIGEAMLSLGKDLPN
jgi:hypothetical protein